MSAICCWETGRRETLPDATRGDATEKKEGEEVIVGKKRRYFSTAGVADGCWWRGEKRMMETRRRSKPVEQGHALLLKERRSEERSPRHFSFVRSSVSRFARVVG